MSTTLKTTAQSFDELKAAMEKLLFDQHDAAEFMYPELYRELQDAYSDLCINSERVKNNIKSIQESIVQESN